MKNASPLAAMIAFGFLFLIATAVPATESVSPGALDRMAQVNNACPTFSWDTEMDAVANEIVAYAIHENDDPATAELTADATPIFAERLTRSSATSRSRSRSPAETSARSKSMIRADTSLSINTR